MPVLVLGLLLVLEPVHPRLVSFMERYYLCIGGLSVVQDVRFRYFRATLGTCDVCGSSLKTSSDETNELETTQVEMSLGYTSDGQLGREKKTRRDMGMLHTQTNMVFEAHVWINLLSNCPCESFKHSVTESPVTPCDAHGGTFITGHSRITMTIMLLQRPATRTPTRHLGKKQCLI